MFSILFSLYFLQFQQGEFVLQSRAPSLVIISFYSYNLNVLFKADTVRRSKILITLNPLPAMSD